MEAESGGSICQHVGTPYYILFRRPGLFALLRRLASRWLVLPQSPSLVLSLKWLVIGNIQKKGRYDWLEKLLQHGIPYRDIYKNSLGDLLYATRITTFRFGPLEENQFRCLIFILGLRSPCHSEIRLRLLFLLDKKPDVKTSRSRPEFAGGLLTARRGNDLSSIDQGDPLPIRQLFDEYQKQSLPRCQFCRERRYHQDCPIEDVAARTAAIMATKKASTENLLRTVQRGRT
ncbi:hypothetical protein ACTXT7_011024 [Hymenolepis weldensis]